MPVARLSLLAIVLVAVACLDDSPIGPGGDHAHVALALEGVLPGAIVEVRIVWLGGERGGSRESSVLALATARVSADSTELRIPLVVDLRPCPLPPTPTSRS